MSKHTPGPWKAYVNTSHFGLYHVDAADRNEVYGDEDEANARLISKAPDMYDLLVRLRDWRRCPGRYEGDASDLAVWAEHIIDSVDGGEDGG